MKYLKLIVFSNVYIAIAAGLMMMQSCIILNLPASKLSWLTFFGTLFLYNFHRLYRFRKSRLVNASRYQWVIDHRPLLVILTITGVIGSVYFAQQLRLQSFIFLFLLSLIALAYVIEFIGKSSSKKALRDVPGLKIFIVAMVWSAFVVILPTIQFNNYHADLTVVFFEKCFFIFAITVPFDIRDQHFDKKHQKTLPQLLGTNRAVAIGIIGILISMALCIILYIHSTYTALYLVSQFVAYGFSAWLIFLSKKTRNELFYSFLVDGTIILSAIGTIFLS